MKKIDIVLKFVLILGILGGCEDYVEVGPPDSKVVSEVVFQSDALATAAVNGMYHRMFGTENFASGWRRSVTTIASLSADDLEVNPVSLEWMEFRENQIDPINSVNASLWASAYNTIYMANAIVEGLDVSEEISEDVKRQLKGEALFVRAFCHFYLVNLFGNVPLITTTDYSKNAKAIQNSPPQVYEQIIADLNQAAGLLDNAYRDGQRIHVNLGAAQALLARVYLYTQRWDMAEALATQVIQSGIYALETDLDQVFLGSSKEAIWQISPTTVGHTQEGNIFILVDSPYNASEPSFFLSPELLAAFEPDDLRFGGWIGALESNGDTFYYPYKYKIRVSSEQPTEYSTVIRLAEVYLIRSEARARQGDIPGALEDLNSIRSRAQLTSVTASTMEEMLTLVVLERRVELFCEWGHRWLDLKRNSLSDLVLAPIKSNWEQSDVLYPIPETEIGRNPQLNQNTGY